MDGYAGMFHGIHATVMDSVKEVLWNISQNIINNFVDLHSRDKLFLNNNTEPWEEVLEKWKNTYNLRKHSEHQSVHEFLRDWKILSDPRSEILNVGDIEQVIQEQKQKATSKQLSVQPYVILQGSLLACDSPLLIVDDVKYHLPSIVKAFDTLFKRYMLDILERPFVSDHTKMRIWN